MAKSDNTILTFWTRINNAEPKFTAKARALLAYYQVNNANNRDWYCRNEDVRKNLGWEPDRPRKIWSEATLQKYKRELVERHVITSNDVYATGNMDEKDHRKKGCRIIVNFDWNETNNHQKSNVISSSAISNNTISDLVYRKEEPLEEKKKKKGKIDESADSAKRSPYVRDEGGPSPLPPAPPKNAKAKKPKKESRKKSPFNPPDPELLKQWEKEDRSYFDEVGDENDEGMKIPRLKELRDFIELKIIQQCDDLQYWDDTKLNNITEKYWYLYESTGWDGIKDWRGYIYKRLEQYGFHYEPDQTRQY